MAKNLFVVGIGGTGMRCLESFIHLCAIGMFDNTEINMLALDTDKDNGNFKRLKELKNAYQGIKGGSEKQTQLQDSFFSAKINYYQFSPDYSRKNNYSQIVGYINAQNKELPNPDNKFHAAKESDLADLLFSEDVREFNLEHGYRAQTHLGSLLMYHSIIEDAKENPKSQFKEFVNRLLETTDARVFIFGSVFGGTGASSIPIIPKAIDDIAALNNQKCKATYGSVILTGYFSFNYKNMSNEEKRKEKIVATSEKFALNSQAALMFYYEDATVNEVYNRLYLLGSRDIKQLSTKNEINTGGEKQENNAHYLELMSAFAAYHFFNEPENTLKNASENKFYYIKPDLHNGRFSFGNFVNDNKDKEKFRKKFGMFVVSSYLALIENYDLFNQAGKGKGIAGYENIKENELKALHSYFKLFNFKFNGDAIENGWLRQIYDSAGGMLFDSRAFACDNKKAISKLEFNKHLYDDKENTFSTGLFGNIFDKVRNEMKNVNDLDNITSFNEKLINRVYRTLCNLYNFK